MYAVGAVIAVGFALVCDTLITRARLIGTSRFWATYSIVLIGQLAMNGVLTGLPVVTYDWHVVAGARIAYAPVEDLFFGFGLVLTVLSLWERTRIESTPGSDR